MNAKAVKVSKKTYVGIACPDCATPARTMHTYHVVDGAQIQRRRICPNGHRFSTMERIYRKAA